MRRQQVLQVGIAVVLMVFFLVGCGGGAPTAVSEAPAATSAPEQAAATPTPEPPTATPEPPTDTPTPEPPTATPTSEPPTATPTPKPPPPTSTPVPPTATPTPVPPTATPTTDATVGQVKGVLIDGATKQPVKGKQIFLATAVESGGEVSMSMNINTSPKVKSDNAGVFLFENLPPDRYILVLDPFFALMDEGQFVIIEVNEGQAVDLGTILVQGSVPELP